MEIKKERREWGFSLVPSLIGWREWIQHLFNLSVIRKKHWNDIELCFEVFETKNQSINYYWFTVHIEILLVVFVNHNITPFVDSISNRQIHLTLIKLREELNSGISITRIDMCINDKVQSKGRIGIIQHSSIPLFPFHYWYIIFMNSIDHINVIIEFIRNRTVGDNSNSTLEW